MADEGGKLGFSRMVRLQVHYPLCPQHPFSKQCDEEGWRMCGTCSFTQQRLCCPFPLLGALGGQGTVPLFSRQGWAATTHQHNKITLCGHQTDLGRIWMHSFVCPLLSLWVKESNLSPAPGAVRLSISSAAPLRGQALPSSV